jgi:hypothetical protein
MMIKMESRYKTLIDLDILITQSDQIPHKRRLCFLLEPTGVSIVMKKTMGLVSTLMLSAVMFTGCQNMSPSNQRIGAAALGGAVGGAWVVATKVGMTAVGVTGLPGLAIVVPATMVNYIIGMALAFGVAFVGAWLFGLGGKQGRETAAQALRA